MKTITQEDKKIKATLKNIFGEDEEARKERIRRKSIFGSF